MHIKKIFVAIALWLGIAVPGVFAAQIDVGYTISGNSGNWVLDFGVTNNISSTTGEMDIYFFGVRLPARNIGNSPSNWDPDLWPNWDNSSYGGTAGFNNNWIDFSVAKIQFGETLSGFIVNVATAAAPSSVDWFAFAEDSGRDSYSGSFDDTVYDSLRNPGFEGVAMQTNGVPEPTSLALLGLGLAGLGFIRRRRT